jgi:hypothetical protein
VDALAAGSGDGSGDPLLVCRAEQVQKPNRFRNSVVPSGLKHTQGLSERMLLSGCR